MMKSKIGLLTTTLAAVILQTQAFSSRKVSPACSTMQPLHFPFGLSGQSTSSPYAIFVTPEENGSYIATIYGTAGNKFKGFLLQARNPQNDEHVGIFNTVQRNSQIIDCTRRGGAVQHLNPVQKDQVSARWVPGGYSGSVQFKATVVQSYNVYWTDVYSESFNV